MISILFQAPSDHHIANCDSNLGCAAIIKCTKSILEHYLGDIEIVSLMQISSLFALKNDIKVIHNKTFSHKWFSLWESIKSDILLGRCVAWYFLNKYLHVNLKLLTNHRILNEYCRADLIVDLSMDHMNDVMGGILKVYEHTRDLLIGIILQKPVVMFAQSIGPYRGKFAALVAKIGLNHVSLITVREGNSLYWLKKIGVTKPPIYLTADPAFLLESGSEETIHNICSKFNINTSNRPIIGIAVPEGNLLGAQTWRGYKKYLRSAFHFLNYCLPETFFWRIMALIQKHKFYRKLVKEGRNKILEDIAKVADYTVNELNATVILIPHVLLPEGQGIEEDARTTVKMIHNLVSNKKTIIPIDGTYSAEDMKGIIGVCDVLVTMKMHAAIAAMSQTVPTIVIGSHPKFSGIMNTLGMTDWVCDKFIVEEITGKIRAALIEKEQIRQLLSSNMKNVLNKSMENGKLIKNLLNMN